MCPDLEILKVEIRQQQLKRCDWLRHFGVKPDMTEKENTNVRRAGKCMWFYGHYLRPLLPSSD